MIPPQRVTSGWTTSMRPPLDQVAEAPERRVLLACRDPQLDRIGELGVGVELVRLERLLEPVDAKV